MVTQVSGLDGIDKVKDGTIKREDLDPSFTPVCSATFTGTTVNATVQTPLTTNTKEVDSHGFLQADGKFKPNIAGYYNISAAVGNGGTSVTGLGCTIRRTGSSGGRTYGASVGTNVNSPWQAINATALVYFNGVDDYVTVDAYAAATGFTGVGYIHAFLVRAT